jgi:hypothetical protein
MRRALRIRAGGLVYRDLNRGNNRGAVFHGPDDFLAFRRALGQTHYR